MRVKLPSVRFEEKDGFVDDVFRDIAVGLHDMQDVYYSIDLTIGGESRDCVVFYLNDGSPVYVLMDLETFEQVLIGMTIAMNRTYDYSEFVDFSINEYKLN